MTWQLFWQRPSKNAIESIETTKPVATGNKRSRRGPGWFRKNGGNQQYKNSDVNLSCPTLATTTESSLDATHWNDSLVLSPSTEMPEASPEQEQQRGDAQEEVRCSEPRTSVDVEGEDLAYDSYRPAPRDDDDSVSTMTAVDDDDDDDWDYSDDDCLYINADEDSLEKEYLTEAESYPEATPETIWKIHILDDMLLEHNHDPHSMPTRQPLYFRIYFPNEDVCYMGKQVLSMVQDLIEFNGRSAFQLHRLSNNEITEVPSSEVLDTLKQILHESSYLSCPEQEFHRAASSLSQCATRE